MRATTLEYYQGLATLGIVTPPLQHLDLPWVERKYLYAAALQDVRSNDHTWAKVGRKLATMEGGRWLRLLYILSRAGRSPDDALFEIVEYIGAINMPPEREASATMQGRL